MTVYKSTKSDLIYQHIKARKYYIYIAVVAMDYCNW